jgi:glutaminyl-tRNA synthetase
MCVRPFAEAHPDSGGKDFLQSLNPNSLKVVNAYVKPSMAGARQDQKFQFERFGYFVVSCLDHVAGEKPEFKRVTGLKENWAK